eukprot:7390037-Prymnesium_polylepis.4
MRDVANTIVIRKDGEIVAANLFYVGTTVYDVPIFDVQLFACAASCVEMKIPQDEWASHVLLKAMSTLCVRAKFHIVAQSVGYNYLLAKSDDDGGGMQHVMIQEENSKGRIFWAKHLQRDFASVILGTQMLCTDETSVHGDCTFMHFECNNATSRSRGLFIATAPYSKEHTDRATRKHASVEKTPATSAARMLAVFVTSVQ